MMTGLWLEVNLGQWEIWDFQQFFERISSENLRNFSDNNDKDKHVSLGERSNKTDIERTATAIADITIKAQEIDENDTLQV